MGSTLFIVWRESVEAMLVVGIPRSWLTFNAAYWLLMLRAMRPTHA